MSLESMGIYNPDYAAGLGESILAVKDTAEQRRGANQEESSKQGSAEDVLPYGEGLNEQMLKRQEIDVARKNFRDIMDRNDKANIGFETTRGLEKTKQGIGKLDATQEEIRRSISQEVSEVDDNKGAGERIREKSYQGSSSQEKSSVSEEQWEHNKQHEKTNLSALYERLLSGLRTLYQNSEGWEKTYGDLTPEDVADRLRGRLKASDTSSPETVENSVGTSATDNADTESASVEPVPSAEEQSSTTNEDGRREPNSPYAAVIQAARKNSGNASDSIIPPSAEPVEPNSSNVSSSVKSGISSMYNIGNERQKITGIYSAIGNEPAEPSGIYKSVMEGDQARRQEKIREQEIFNIQEQFIRDYGLSVEGEEAKRDLEIFSQNLYSLREMIKMNPDDYNNKEGFTGNMNGVLGAYGSLKESGISLPSEGDFMKAQFGEDLGGELLGKYYAMYENTNLESSDNESDKVPYDLESRLSIFENSDVQLEGDSEDARENVAHLVGMTQDEITDNPELFIQNLIELRAQIKASDLPDDKKLELLRAMSNAHTSFKILLPENFDEKVEKKAENIRNSGEQVHIDNSELEQPSTPAQSLTNLAALVGDSSQVELDNPNVEVSVAEDGSLKEDNSEDIDSALAHARKIFREFGGKLSESYVQSESVKNSLALYETALKSDFVVSGFTIFSNTKPAGIIDLSSQESRIVAYGRDGVKPQIGVMIVGKEELTGEERSIVIEPKQVSAILNTPSEAPMFKVSLKNGKTFTINGIREEIENLSNQFSKVNGEELIKFAETIEVEPEAKTQAERSAVAEAIDWDSPDSVVEGIYTLMVNNATARSVSGVGSRSSMGYRSGYFGSKMAREIASLNDVDSAKQYIDESSWAQGLEEGEKAKILEGENITEIRRRMGNVFAQQMVTKIENIEKSRSS